MSGKQGTGVQCCLGLALSRTMQFGWVPVGQEITSGSLWPHCCHREKQPGKTSFLQWSAPTRSSQGSAEGRQSLQQKCDHQFWLLSCGVFHLFYRTSLTEGSFSSECFTFFKFQSVVFLNPLKITILGAQVACARRILCHKTAVTIRVWKTPQFHGFRSQDWAVPHPTWCPDRGEGAGRALGAPLEQPFLRVLHLRGRKLRFHPKSQQAVWRIPTSSKD